MVEVSEQYARRAPTTDLSRQFLFEFDEFPEILPEESHEIMQFVVDDDCTQIFLKYPDNRLMRIATAHDPSKAMLEVKDIFRFVRHLAVKFMIHCEITTLPPMIVVTMVRNYSTRHVTCPMTSRDYELQNGPNGPHYRRSPV